VSSIRDKILHVLSEEYPIEIRFSELYEKCGRPSRSAFSKHLRLLEQEKLIVRTEVSYKHVTYLLKKEMINK